QGRHPALCEEGGLRTEAQGCKETCTGREKLPSRGLHRGGRGVLHHDHEDTAMSMVFYEAGSLTIGVNADEVAEKLGELRNKTPAVIKVAANYTARETRKEMLRRAMRRYAVNTKGKEKLQGLKQRVKATNAS